MPDAQWFLRLLTVGVGLALCAAPAGAEPQRPAAPLKGCEELFALPKVIWRGSNGTMRFEELAAYAAPVFWLSPDEPTNRRKSGRDIRVPAALPFESPADSPVVYYQIAFVDEVRHSGDAEGVQLVQRDKGQSLLNFDIVNVIHIKYIAYFPEESGVGQHLHDLEPTAVKIFVGRANGQLARTSGHQCDSTDYLAVLDRVTGEAHGNPWYYNVLNVDQATTLPVHLLVEEGKHAMATDKNADGFFTPGFDVSVRTNDAWGVRDTISGGSLMSGRFEAWMAKPREAGHRILPPLPADSPLRERLAADVGPAQNAVYELRPYPVAASATDQVLRVKMQEKETKDWPVERASTDIRPIADAVREGLEFRPYSIAYRYDGQAGFAVAFPLLFVKNVHEPLSGGYLVNRVYFKDDEQHDWDWAWMVMYTPSASRWFDQYVAGGIETDRFTNPDGTRGRDHRFVGEFGAKLRFRAPNRLLGVLTRFWGFRIGVQAVDGVKIEEFRYLIEIGAGVW